MNLGNFSLSLAVADLAVSRAFYEKLGFQAMGGAAEQGWLIMSRPGCTIGLFQGMFERNMLTFNPGWDDAGQKLDRFTDIRQIQKDLKAAGLALVQEADENGEGPASCMVIDPDGNPILIDQHV
ncbi:MAG: VOC family protein [Sneathiellaceae bacterium]